MSEDNSTEPKEPKFKIPDPDRNLHVPPDAEELDYRRSWIKKGREILGTATKHARMQHKSRPR